MVNDRDLLCQATLRHTGHRRCFARIFEACRPRRAVFERIGEASPFWLGAQGLA